MVDIDQITVEDVIEWANAMRENMSSEHGTKATTLERLIVHAITQVHNLYISNQGRKPNA